MSFFENSSFNAADEEYNVKRVEVIEGSESCGKTLLGFLGLAKVSGTVSSFPGQCLTLELSRLGN